MLEAETTLCKDNVSHELTIYEPRHEKNEFCLCKNKGADQLCSNCTVDQCLCFCYRDSTINLINIQNFQLLAFFCDCTGQLESERGGNPEDLFFQDAENIYHSMLYKTKVEVKGKFESRL